MLQQVGHCQILEVAVALDTHRVAQHSEPCGHVTGDVHLTGGIAQHTELCRGIVAQQGSLLLGQLSAQPQQVLGHTVGNDSGN